ncbi:PGPGW domain-containing protein [Geminicoccaceae bacterium 1502E]|uniref:PGPGW domain-containing protein n=1 Tax=Marinimicrococcus flavescens TaxID=3031815 RepID=A0AAP3XTQ8_9PROT|nr:PGPGW domain-containing protein [Marinimicrococcus flavescens]MDX6749749.1 PGPGW domain-containing protein [Geminicoccaceae bacterium 1502E]
MTRIAMMGLGYGFLVLGVLGLFLPFLQGILFLLVGLLILARHAPWAERMLERLKGRHPHLKSSIEKAEALADRWSERTRAFFKRLVRRVRG